MAVTWNYENAAHLLSRVGFGGTPEDIENFRSKHASVTTAVDELLDYKPSAKKPPAKDGNTSDLKEKMQRWWIKTMAKTRRPSDACREKLVVFYHDFLVSGASKQDDLKTMSWQNRLFRVHGKGNFKDLIREFNRDPANLYYLDGILNDARNDEGIVVANENFGREVLELFTLGVFELAADGLDDPTKPNYTEDDVHQLSRALTGWVDVENEVGVWVEDAWDGGNYDDDGDGLPDDITIFGVTNNNFRIDSAVAGGPNDVLELIFSRTDDAGNNQVAMFVARKFWEWYAYPAPAPGLKALLAGFASTFESSGYSVEALLRAMWTSDEFYSAEAKSRTVKSPLDFMMLSFKGLGVRANGKAFRDQKKTLAEHLEAMGMDLFEPTNVAGWKGGTAWITSSTLFARLNFASELGVAKKGSNRLKLRKLDKVVFGNAATPAEDAVDQVISQLCLDMGPVQLTSVQRDALIAYATDDGAKPTLDLSSDKTDDANEKLRGIITLALQTAENQIF